MADAYLILEFVWDSSRQQTKEQRAIMTQFDEAFNNNEGLVVVDGKRYRLTRISQGVDNFIYFWQAYGNEVLDG